MFSARESRPSAHLLGWLCFFSLSLLFIPFESIQLNTFVMRLGKMNLIRCSQSDDYGTVRHGMTEEKMKKELNSVALTDYRSQIVHLPPHIWFLSMREREWWRENEMLPHESEYEISQTHLHSLNTIPIVPRATIKTKPITTQKNEEKKRHRAALIEK